MQAIIKTSCEKCSFAQFHNKVQVGCYLDRLDKFRGNGANVELTTQGYFVVKDRFCNAYMNAYTTNMVKPEVRRKEIAVNIELIIICNKDTTLEEIKTTYESELAQTLPSKRISIGVDFNLSEEVVNFFRNQNSRQWRVETIADDNYNYDRYLHLVVRKVTQPGIILFKAGTSIPEDFNSNIDAIINDDLRQVSLIEPDENGNGMFCSTSLYLGVGGDYDMAFVDKVKQLAKEGNNENMILQHEEV